MFFKYFVKMWIAVYLVSHTFTITMAVFDVGQHIVNSAAGVITGNTAIDISTALTDLDAKMEYAQMLKSQLAKGNNGLVKSKYITFSIEAESWKKAKPRLERIETDILNNFKVLGVMAYPLNGEERLQILYETFNPDIGVPFQFDYKQLLKSGLTTKDFVAPSSFLFKSGKDFMMGDTIGAASYLQILAPELTDKMLAEFLDIDKNLIVNLHVQSVDQMKAIKLVKSKVTDINRMKIEEQKKAVRAGYDMDILPSDLNTYGGEAARLLEDLQSRNERMFLVTALFLNTAESKQELENAIFQTAGVAQKYNCALKRLDYMQEEGLMSSVPLGVLEIYVNEERNLIINYAFKLDDMDKTRELIEKIHDGIEAGDFHTVNVAMDEAQKEIAALPDGMVGLFEMHEFGYSGKEMLPLTKDRALELFQDGCEVFHLYPDDTEETVDAEEDFDTLDEFYGIETDTWERYRLQETERNDIGLQNTEEYQEVNFFDVPALFSNGRVNSNAIPEGIYRYELQGASYDPGYPLYVKEAVGVNHAGTVLTTVPVTVENTDSLRLGDGLDFSGGTQTLAEYQKIMAGRNRTSDSELVQSTMGRNNEAVYLNGVENRYAIYQIVESTKGSEYKFMNLDFVTSHGMAVDAADYAYTFGGYLTENDTLDSIYERFNLNHPESYIGHSLSVSDVVVMQKDGQTKAYYVDSFGFSEVPEFVQQRLHEAQMIQKREDSMITLDTTAVEIEQHEGQWHTVDKMEIEGEIFYLMRHNEYGNSVAAVILNSDGELVAQDLEKGFDRGAMEAIQEFLHDRGIEWNMEEESEHDLEEDDREITYWIAKEEKYLYFQTGSEGYDYTIYDSEYKEEDGGVLDDPEMRFEDALRDILENELNVTTEDCEEVDSEEFLEIVERAEYFPQKSYELLKEQMDKDVPEIAFQSGYGYAYIQRVEKGFNTIVYDSDWKEISGSFYEASDVPMEKAVGWFFRDEELGTLECVPMNPEELKKNALQAAKKRLTEEELAPTSEVDIKEAVLNGQSRNDIEVTVLSLAQSEIEEQGLENEVKLLGARVFGSRTRVGLYTDTSDVDVVLSYTGNIREDVFFNSLNEYGLSVAGLKVDINPISLEQTGTLEEYMEKAEAYLDKRELEKLAENIDQFSEDYDTYGYRDAVEGKEANVQMIYSNLLSGETEFIRNWLTEIAENRENDTDDMVKGAADLLKRVDEIPKNEMEKAEPEVTVPEEKEATITFYVAECMEFPVMGEYHDNLSLEEALKIYETIPEERMHGIKGIGFTLHDGSIYDDMEYELMAADEIRDDMFELVPYYKENPMVQKAVADVKAYLSAKKEKEAEISTISEGVEPEITEKSKPEKEKEIPEKAGSKKESVLKALRERQAKIKAQEQEKPAEKSHSKKKGEQEL